MSLFIPTELQQKELPWPIGHCNERPHGQASGDGHERLPLSPALLPLALKLFGLMHTPSAAAARPLPKRTRSSAGLEEIDVWLGQITSTTSATTSVNLSTVSPVAVSRGDPTPPYGLSRKRHHSLPATALAGSLQSLAATMHAKSTTKPTTRRPELALFGGGNGAAFSNQYSPRLDDPHALDASAYSFLPTTNHHHHHNPQQHDPMDALQLPEMSPREDFLVRAFVSDAMKLESVDDHSYHRSSGSSPGAYRPLEIRTAMDDAVSTASSTPTSLVPPTTPATHHKWTREEDDKLRDAVARFGGKSWKLIAERLGNGRTDVQCLHRWNKVLKPGLVKGPWTPDEDRILLNLIARYGVGQIRWCDVALHLPGRIGKQCRERWCNHLDSSIRKGQWTPEEDDTVFRLQQTLGNKWSEIAKHLPGRTENAVKNRFNSAARRKWILSQAGANTSAVSARGRAMRGQQPPPPPPPPSSSHPPSLLLSSDLLVGPPRPPPTMAPFRFTSGGPVPDHASPLPAFVFGDDAAYMPHLSTLPDAPAFATGPPLFRGSSVSSSVSLASLLSPATPHDRDRETPEDEDENDNQATHSPERPSPSRRLSLDAHVVIKQEPLDEDPSTLRAIDVSDANDVNGPSLVDMDDQNMSTFLDSVALELDDIIE